MTLTSIAPSNPTSGRGWAAALLALLLFAFPSTAATPGTATVLELAIPDGASVSREQRVVDGEAPVLLSNGQGIHAKDLPVGANLALSDGRFATVTATKPAASKPAPPHGMGRVVGIVELQRRQTLTLRLPTGDVETTPEHLFWVPRQGWVPARALRPGEELAGKEGPVRLQAVGESSKGPRAVYNLIVTQDPTYRVGSASVLVHNGQCFGKFASPTSPFRVAHIREAARDGTLYFHVTTQDNARSILKQGLDPAHGGRSGAGDAIRRDGTDPRYSPVDADVFNYASQDYAFFASKPETAQFYAQHYADRGVAPVVLALRIREGEASMLPDKRGGYGAFRTRDQVPPSSITVFPPDLFRELYPTVPLPPTVTGLGRPRGHGSSRQPRPQRLEAPTPLPTVSTGEGR